MALHVIEGGRKDGQPRLDRDGRPLRDEVGEMLRALCREVMAEPIAPHLLEFSLNAIPVGNYDDSTMRG